MAKKNSSNQESVFDNLENSKCAVHKPIKLEDKPMVHHIPPHYVGYTNLTLHYHTMIATNLSGNIAIGIHNHEAHKTALAHIDETTSFSSVLRIFDKIRQEKDEVLELFITGGNHSSFEKFAPLLKALKNLPKVDIVMNNSFPNGKTAEFVQHLGLDAHGLYYTDKAPLWHAVIHPGNSPQIDNINYFSKVGGTYPIIEIDYSSPTYEPLVVMGDYHPHDYQ